ncbi:MAG: hypothetical protein CFE32_05715 [Alphaproteobacteria bacterium PA3]|nr:MAG: hypothetical protein CFE32_05715 [Alphaproteobacteria bacterium PA3]
MTGSFSSTASQANVKHARLALEEAIMGPSKADLDAAPLLSLWQPILMGRDVCLAGAVKGHPLLSAQYITTSPLIALGPMLDWARTFSRFYTLNQYLPHVLTGGLAIDGRQIEVVDVYGWPALDLTQVQSYLSTLAELIRATTTLDG